MRKIILGIIILCVLGIPAGIGAEPLSLEKSIEIALANNHSLHSASKKVSSAKEKIWEAKTYFYPAMNISSIYTKLNEPPSISMGHQIYQLSDDDIYDIKGTLQQTIFSGGKILAGYELAKCNYEGAKYEYEKVRNELLLEVKTAYFGILKALKFRQIAQETVEQVEAHLKVVRNFYDAGMVVKVDVLKAEVQLANVKQNLVRAENRVNLTKARFNQLLAQDQNAPVELVDIMEVKPYTVDMDKCIKEAQALRPELNQIKANISILEQRVKIARADYYPSVALIGNYDYQKGKTTPIDEWEKVWTAGVMVNFNLWDWNAKKSRVNQAEDELKGLKEQQLLLIDVISLEVREAFFSLEEAEKNIGVAQKAIGQAEENLRITKEMYKKGTATSTDVLDAQTLLTQAKTNYYQTLYDYNLAFAKLQKAIGR